MNPEDIPAWVYKDWYKLDSEKNVVPIESAAEWREWMVDIAKRRVAGTYLYYEANGTPQCGWISTVFLGLDHGFRASGPPVVFESMLFDCPFDEQGMRRYCTWKEALVGHEEECARVESYLLKEGYTFSRHLTAPDFWMRREKTRAEEHMGRLKNIKDHEV